MGALRASGIAVDRAWAQLHKIEVGLCAWACASPLYLGFMGRAHLEQALGAASWVIFPLSFLPVLVIGFLSGYEVPLLMALGRTEVERRRVLAWDYVGSFFAALLYAFWLVPSAGLIVTLFSTCLLNLLVAVFLSLRLPRMRIVQIVELAAMAALVFFLYRSDLVENLLRQWMLL